MERTEMEYIGPGTKPPNIFVEEREVDALEKAGYWTRAGATEDETQPTPPAEGETEEGDE